MGLGLAERSRGLDQQEGEHAGSRAAGAVALARVVKSGSRTGPGAPRGETPPDLGSQGKEQKRSRGDRPSVRAARDLGQKKGGICKKLT